jgi:zinc protease
MTGAHRESVQDRVAQARLYKFWNVPGWGTECADKLDLASSILADGKTSRLYKRLIYDDQIASSVSCYINTREIGGQFASQADAKPGVDQGREGHDEELVDSWTARPRPSSSRSDQRARLSRDRRIGGGGKSDLRPRAGLRRSPDSYKKTLAHEEAGGPVRHSTLSDGLILGPPLPALKPTARRQPKTSPGPRPSHLPALQQARGRQIMRGLRHASRAHFSCCSTRICSDQDGLDTLLAMNARRGHGSTAPDRDELAMPAPSTASILDTRRSPDSARDKLDQPRDLRDVILPAFPGDQRLQKLQIARITGRRPRPRVALQVFETRLQHRPSLRHPYRARLPTPWPITRQTEFHGPG